MISVYMESDSILFGNFLTTNWPIPTPLKWRHQSSLELFRWAWESLWRHLTLCISNDTLTFSLSSYLKSSSFGLYLAGWIYWSLLSGLHHGKSLILRLEADTTAQLLQVLLQLWLLCSLKAEPLTQDQLGLLDQTLLTDLLRQQSHSYSYSSFLFVSLSCSWSNLYTLNSQWNLSIMKKITELLD